MNFKVIIYIFTTLLVAQSDYTNQRAEINSTQLIPVVSGEALDSTINPDTYIVGPGDQFYFSMIIYN